MTMKIRSQPCGRDASGARGDQLLGVSTIRLAVDLVALAGVNSALRSVQTDAWSQYIERQSSAVKPIGDVCMLAIPVGRKAYKALMKLTARRGQRTTRPRANI